ncbi:unnamed protein product [marine sediment metagenome]|uniref:Uncharacterized protein n=1 Tax=marine sediment metagenome TaxID=412755 RepID=X1NNL0_9ZZZZ
MSKEYLDKDKVDLILHKFGRAILDAKLIDKKLCDVITEYCSNKNSNSIKFNHEIDKAFKNSITQLCQLKPKNQVVIAEGELFLSQDNGITMIKDRKFINVDEKLYKYQGKKVKIILEEE